MTRKEFLRIAAGAVVLPAVAAMSGCKSSTTGTDNTDPNSRTFTSTNVQSHTHTVSLTRTEIDAAAGVVKTTSSGGGHTHTFTMTAAEVTGVKNGTPAAIDTTIDSGHFHQFAIQKWY